MCIPISNSPACGTAFSSKTLQVAQKWFWELFSLQNDQSHLEGKLLMNIDDNSGPKRVSGVKTRFGLRKPSNNDSKNHSKSHAAILERKVLQRCNFSVWSVLDENAVPQAGKLLIGLHIGKKWKYFRNSQNNIFAKSHFLRKWVFIGLRANFGGQKSTKCVLSTFGHLGAPKPTERDFFTTPTYSGGLGAPNALLALLERN